MLSAISAIGFIEKHIENTDETSLCSVVEKREFFAKPEVKEMSAGLEEIAEAVAVAVEDKTLRDRIYAKCMEKFDGETNVLWQQLEGDDNLRSKGGWSKKIDDLVSKGRKNTIVKGVGNVDAAVKKFEKIFNAPIHLFWAFPANWDKKTTPLVAFVPMDGDPEKRKSVPAFDAKGNRIEIDSHDPTFAKQRPVIVITFNERTLADGSKKPGLIIPNAQGRVTFPETQNTSRAISKSGAQLTSLQTIRVDWVEVPSEIIDEPWLDGTTEWIYTYTLFGYWDPADPYSNAERDYVTLTLGWYQSRYYPNNSFALATPFFNNVLGPATQIQFRYFEDDFFINQYDIFDDWRGYHYGGRLVTNVNAQGNNVGFQTGTFTMSEAGTTAQYTIY